MVGAQHGVFYMLDATGDEPRLKLLASYALPRAQGPSATQFELGEGLVGQCALEKQKILLDQRARATTSGSAPGWARPRR